jgi:hypothetical protein
VSDNELAAAEAAEAELLAGGIDVGSLSKQQISGCTTDDSRTDEVGGAMDEWDENLTVIEDNAGSIGDAASGSIVSDDEQVNGSVAVCVTIDAVESLSDHVGQSQAVDDDSTESSEKWEDCVGEQRTDDNSPLPDLDIERPTVEVECTVIEANVVASLPSGEQVSLEHKLTVLVPCEQSDSNTDANDDTNNASAATNTPSTVDCHNADDTESTSTVSPASAES